MVIFRVSLLGITFREFPWLNKLRKGPMQQIKEVATAIVEQMPNVQGTSSARAASRYMHIPHATVRKILYQMLQF